MIQRQNMASVVEFQLREREPRRKGMVDITAEIIILPAVRIERLSLEPETPAPHTPDRPLRIRAGKR